MVVDDEPQLERLILQRFRRKIRDNQYQFSFAQNGIEALKILTQDQGFDIVLSDINMPKMDGLTFISRLNEISTMLKTVMVSAYGDMKNIRTAMNRGAYDFVTKPIDFDDLDTTIQKALKEIETLKLAAQVQEELNRIHSELYAANEIQQSILTKNFSVFPKESRFEIFAKMDPAKEIGGDFYDFFKIDDTHVGLVIGDVSGKGMPAALFMAISRTLLRAIALKGEATDQCLNQVNHLLSQDNPKNMFVTVFYAKLNIKSGEMEYCNGGHNPPILLSSVGGLTDLSDSKNIALGIEDNFIFKSSVTSVKSGHSLIFYTDGITEALDVNNNEFSIDRLKKYLGGRGESTPEGVINGVIQEVQDFAVGAQQSDDITVMVVKQNPEGS